MAAAIPGRAIMRAPRRHAPKRASSALDSYDISILSALIDNPRASAAELTNTVHLSRTAVTRRIASLIESGVLDRLQRSISFEDVGLGVRASIELTTPLCTLDEVCQRLLARPEVLEITVMSGGTTLVADVVAVDIPHLRQFIRSIEGVSDTVTRIVFSKMRSPMTLRDRLRRLEDQDLSAGKPD